MEFRKSVQAGFVLTAELNPPRGVDAEPLLRKIEGLAPGFDGFSVTDDSLAKLRMNAMAFAALVRRRVDIPLLMHLTCRDMGILKLHDYLLGAWALDIHNVVCMTGDPPRIGTFPDLKGVYQLNSFQLCNLVAQLNKGVLSNGEKLASRPDFYAGCVANPYSLNIRVEAKRLQKKYDNGAEYVITQPIYTRRTLDQFLEATADIPMKKLIGVLPLRGVKMAQQIADSVPDIYMPAEVFERLEKNDTPEEGQALARELIADIRSTVDGIHIFALNHFDSLRALLADFPERAARTHPAPEKSRGKTADAKAADSPPPAGASSRARPGNGRDRAR